MDESPPSSFSAGESSQTPEASEEPTATAEPATTTTAPVDESEQSTAANGEKQQSGCQSNGNGTSNLPQTVPSQPPAATEPPKTDTPATPTPQPTEPPKPKTAYDAPYNTATIIADAKAYGESIGMTWSAPLTKDNCSWEAPIQTSSVLSGERLKAAIESGIRRVKKLQADNEYQQGEFHFQLYLEPFGNGEYSLYFLMG
ncbi:hypothetical protein FACS189415_6460 [Bacteroidia bacterium]|nr:hypothetical protein FACS189415_6460 [Bacteroidia bacterium]